MADPKLPPRRAASGGGKRSVAAPPVSAQPVPPARGARQVAKDETRAEILRIAREELSLHGFDGASIRTIAGRAGVATGTVALHFGDKLGLVQAMLHADLEVALAEAFASVPKRGLGAQLRHVAERVFGYYREGGALSRMLLSASLFSEEPWRGRFIAQAATAHGSLAGLVAQAIERGELPPETEPALVALTFLSFHYFALISWVQGAGPEPVALVDRLMTVHLAALRGVKPRLARSGRDEATQGKRGPR